MEEWSRQGRKDAVVDQRTLRWALFRHYLYWYVQSRRTEEDRATMEGLEGWSRQGRKEFWVYLDAGCSPKNRWEKTQTCISYLVPRSSGSTTWEIRVMRKSVLTNTVQTTNAIWIWVSFTSPQIKYMLNTKFNLPLTLTSVYIFISNPALLVDNQVERQYPYTFSSFL